MDENEFGALAQAKTTPVTNPTTEIAKIMTYELIKILELKEYCTFMECDLKKNYSNVETLSSDKIEKAKVISEYKNRNKINATNSESLRQALNELYKYKCELKSCYIATQKAFKSKKLKYKKIISSYESAWDKTLKEYDGDPVVRELHKIEQENILLQREIEKQEKLFASTKIQFLQEKQNSEKAFREKIVNFSKAMVEFADFLKSTKRNKKAETCQDFGKFKFKFTKPEGCIRKGHLTPDVSDDPTYTCSIDVSVFDDIMVPTENLESQHLEEDAYSFGQNDERRASDTSRDPEGLECLNYQQTASPNNKNSAQNETSVQGEPKAQKAINENESQYFRSVDSSKQIGGENVKKGEQWNCTAKNKTKNNDGSGEKLKPIGSALQQVDSEEEGHKYLQVESEESLNEASYEKQFGNQRDNYESQYHKTSSMSSEEMPGENLNENSGPTRIFCEQNTDLNPLCQLKEKDIKSFTGFFTMESDQDAPKPSIFKLF